MNSHPGGEAQTVAMLNAACLSPGAKILDAGAGAGETVLLLRSLGYDACGIDLVPRASCVQKGDFLNTGFPERSFDAVISQCAFFISGEMPRAVCEAWRVLKEGGLLLLSDVFTKPPAAVLHGAGFTVLHETDLTALWREYYFEMLWKEDAVCSLPHIRCTYHMLIGRRDDDGPV